MKTLATILAVVCMLCIDLHAQVTITAADMFNQVGETFRARGNVLNDLVPAAQFIGSKDGPQFWDFTSGPAQVVYRYDYINPKGTVQGLNFPEATVAERMTNESNGEAQFLFFQQVPNVGRKVFGAFAITETLGDPVQRFTNPIIDFPAEIRFGDKWSYVAIFESDLLGFGNPFGDGSGSTGSDLGLGDLLGGGGSAAGSNPALGDLLGGITGGTSDLSNLGLGDLLGPGTSGISLAANNDTAPSGIPIRVIITSDFEVDGWGFIDLPELGLNDAIRVNELDAQQLQIFDPTTQSFQSLTQTPVMTRIYYWLSPGKGIAAMMVSDASANSILTGNGTPPPDVFETASFFYRMFETNKQVAGNGCLEPSPVTDLTIRRFQNNPNLFLLRWSKTECTDVYKVEYRDASSNSGIWMETGRTEDDFLPITLDTAAPARLYRVVSLRRDIRVGSR